MYEDDVIEIDLRNSMILFLILLGICEKMYCEMYAQCNHFHEAFQTEISFLWILLGKSTA